MNLEFKKQSEATESLPTTHTEGQFLLTKDGKLYFDNGTELIQLNTKPMDKENPTGTGSFSLNRKAETNIGDYSFVEGYDNTASGSFSHAEGLETLASGHASHTEGLKTLASGYASHTEGYDTEASNDSSHAEGEFSLASGYASHAEGSGTVASGIISHAEGIKTVASGYASHAEGDNTVANSLSQHVQGEYNILDIESVDDRGNYAHIVGNGTTEDNRSNAHTLDWSGNAWFAGDVYIGSTSGTNKDEGSKKLATEDLASSTQNGLMSKEDKDKLDNAIITDNKVTNTLDTSTKYYITGTTSDNTNTGTQIFDTAVYVEAGGNLKATKVHGAVWNDYAEYRESNTLEPGRVVCENGNDTLSLSKERLQPGANIISDTFGFAIGETEKAKTPIAVSGRVLAYPYENRNKYLPGDAVCAGPNGTVSKMSREEIMTYPERIIGTVSAIPTYETWGENNVVVNGRIWIKIK